MVAKFLRLMPHRCVCRSTARRGAVFVPKGPRPALQPCNGAARPHLRPTRSRGIKVAQGVWEEKRDRSGGKSDPEERDVTRRTRRKGTGQIRGKSESRRDRMGVANGTLRVRTMIVLSYPLATRVAVDLRRPPVFDLSLLMSLLKPHPMIPLPMVPRS